MKNKMMYFFICIIMTMNACIHALDPIQDFGVPTSLMSCLQDSFCSIADSLQAFSGELSELGKINQDMVNLSSFYDQMINTTRGHMIYSDDKQYLQGLIDRIDQMIISMQADNESEESSQELEAIRSLCLDFKDKICASC